MTSFVASTFEQRVLAAAGIGGWDIDLESGRIRWTAETYRIHEIDQDQHLDLDFVLSFYPPEARDELIAAIQAARYDRAEWDLTLPFLSAQGRQRVIRSTGQPIEFRGRIVRIVGSLQDMTEQSAQAAERERLALVVRQMTNSVMITDADGRTEWVNDAFTRLTGYTLCDIAGSIPGRKLQGPETSQETRARIGAAIAANEPFNEELVNYTKSGRAFRVNVIGTPIRDSAGRLTGYISVQSDITARYEAEQGRLREAARREEAEMLLREVLEALPSPVVAYDQDERLLLWNQAYRDLLPHRPDLYRRGTSLEKLVNAAAEFGVRSNASTDTQATPPDSPRDLPDLLRAYRDTRIPHEHLFPDGRVMQAIQRRSPSGHLVGVRTDITRLKAAEAEAQRRAEEDGLTGLHNRTVLTARLNGALRQRRTDDAAGGCLLLFDIDHFKAINDTLGHDAGDLLLQEIATRLRKLIRPGDTAARLGGDEFALLMPGLNDAEQVSDFVGRMETALSQPVHLSDRQILPSLSAGVTLFPRDGADARTLLKNADLALYDAKRAGRGRWQFFDGRRAAAVLREASIADGLRSAIAKNHIGIALQPKRRLSDGGHDGFEVFARWPDDLPPVSPGEFIPVAESSQQMVPLGNLVLRKTLEVANALNRDGLDPGSFAVNVAAVQLLDGEFATRLAGMLREFSVPPEQIVLEVTETILLDRSAARIGQTLAALRMMGITLALDDFGTGYASLSHLRRFEVQQLKIDSSFISAIGRSNADALIARTIVGLGQGLGLKVVAEGVETEGQADYLREHGCDTIQGYLVARPMTPSDARIFLRRRQIQLVPASMASAN